MIRVGLASAPQASAQVRHVAEAGPPGHGVVADWPGVAPFLPPRQIKNGIELAKQRMIKDGVAIETTLVNNLPRVLGDEAALTEAFAHLVTVILPANPEEF
ncbi:MAG: hypothetical protein ABJB09_07425 [Verrucomicrobiota bacterium]